MSSQSVSAFSAHNAAVNRVQYNLGVIAQGLKPGTFKVKGIPNLQLEDRGELLKVYIPAGQVPIKPRVGNLIVFESVISETRPETNDMGAIFVGYRLLMQNEVGPSLLDHNSKVRADPSIFTISPEATLINLRSEANIEIATVKFYYKMTLHPVRGLQKCFASPMDYSSAPEVRHLIISGSEEASFRMGPNMESPLPFLIHASNGFIWKDCKAVPLDPGNFALRITD